MLACRAVNIQTQALRPAGALDAHPAEVITCQSEGDLSQVLARATREQRRVTMIGGQRSFGEQFLPVAGGLGIDVSRLETGARIVEHLDTGRLLVRVGGGTTFEQLHAHFPGHRVRFVPTSDRVTIAGALAACTHSAAGYFATAVRAFRLLLSSGEVLDCSAAASGLARELFDVVPGSFGALGVTTFIDLELDPIAPQQALGVHARYAAPRLDEGFFAALDAAKDDPRFDEGMGGVIYGNRGRTLVLADERLPVDHAQPEHLRALLTDDNLEEQAFTHGLANRFPRIAESTVTKTYPQGIERWAPWYGFQFYQRGYDRSYEILGRRGLKYSLARLVGVDRRVPVAHQSWFFPRSITRAFVEAYFKVLDAFPGSEKQGEQQDIVLLDPCPFPAHSLGRTQQGVGVLTSSYSLASLSPDQRARIFTFFKQVSHTLYEQLPAVRISLCKQVHCDRDVLRRMHRGWADLMQHYKSQVDPRGVLTSRHLEMLLDR